MDSEVTYPSQQRVQGTPNAEDPLHGAGVDQSFQSLGDQDHAEEEVHEDVFNEGTEEEVVVEHEEVLQEGEILEEEEEVEEEEEEEEGEEEEEDQEFQDTYKDVLNSLSRQWLLTQLNHRVSAKAANQFWDIAMKYLPKLLMFKEREGRQKNVPKFIQQRRKLYANHCPDVHMEFGFQKKCDGSINKISGGTAPLRTFQLNSEYTKLYEITTIKVRLELFR